MTDDDLRRLAEACEDDADWRRAVRDAFSEAAPELRDELSDDPRALMIETWRQALGSGSTPDFSSEAWERWKAFDERADGAWSAVCAERERERRRRERERVRIDRIRTLGAPLRPRDVEMLIRKELDDSAPLRAIQSWRRMLASSPHAPRFLLLLGAAGVGKTVASVDWLTRGPGRPNSAVYVRMRDLATSFAADYGEPSDEWYRAISAPLLVVDEMSCERSERHLIRGRDVAFEILDRRGTQEHATILISNEDRAAFVARYAAGDARMAGRLRADAVAPELGGESLRPRWSADPTGAA